MQASKIWNRTFLAGIAAGIAMLLICRLVVNETTLPDRLLGPLMLEDSSAHAEAIVVLGAGVIGDCVPNLNGTRRTLLAVRLLKQRRAPLLIFTGGSRHGDCPVAVAMARLAREAGVSPDQIIMEQQSRNTRQNAEQTIPLLQARSIQRILLVTDRLHMLRAAGVFRKHGVTVEHSAVPIYEGHLDNVSMLATGLREATALAYYRLRGWTADAPPASRMPRAEASPVGTAGRQASQPTGGKVAPSRPHALLDNRPIVILGASYAAGWPLPAVGTIPVRNVGVNGQQSFEMLARFDADVAAVRPRAVILWGFINDLFRNADAAQALARMRQSYTQMTERARAHGIEPIIATEVTIRPPKTWTSEIKSLIAPLLGKTAYQDRINTHVIQGNSRLREFAGQEKLLLLDLQQVLADSDGRRRRAYATDDGSHLTTDAYEALTQYAQPRLLDRLRTAGTAEGTGRRP